MLRFLIKSNVKYNTMQKGGIVMKRKYLNLKELGAIKVATIGNNDIYEYNDKYLVELQSDASQAEYSEHANFLEASIYASELNNLNSNVQNQSYLEDKDKLRVLNAVIAMLQNQEFTGQGSSFEGWIDGLCDENGNDFIENERQKELAELINIEVGNISYALSNDSDEFGR